jgi:hypothetical protein
MIEKQKPKQKSHKKHRSHEMEERKLKTNP